MLSENSSTQTAALSIPVSETLSFLRFDAKSKEFVAKVIERHTSGDLGYELHLTGEKQTIIIKDDNEICRGAVFPLGLYGFYKKPSEETKDEIKDETKEAEPKATLVHHWTWIWSLPEDHLYRSSFNADGLNKIRELQQQIRDNCVSDDINPSQQILDNTLRTIFDNSNIFSEEPMINSYIESVLFERLQLDTVYNLMVDQEHNLFLALAVKDLIWCDRARSVDIVQASEDDE